MAVFAKKAADMACVFCGQKADYQASLMYCREALSIHPESAWLRDLEVAYTSACSRFYIITHTEPPR